MTLFKMLFAIVALVPYAVGWTMQVVIEGFKGGRSDARMLLKD